MTLTDGGVADPFCLEITNYTASTVASTIEIRSGTSAAPDASAATNGPKVSVWPSATPGPVYVDVWSDDAQVGDNIIIAQMAYAGTPTATTSGQLTVIRGLLNQATGSITFTEGAPNQFGTNYDLELCLVYPSTSYQGAYIWSNPVGANAPVVTTNNTVSGLIARFDPAHSGDGCLDIDVDDMGLGGLGSITISNLKLDVKTDAQLGPIFVRVYTDTRNNNEGPSSSALLQATVSPATVAQKTAISLGAVSALGQNATSGFSTKSPKTQAVGKYVTWKFTGGAALAGKRVNILVAMKVDGAWTGPKYLKSVWADANGIVTFSWKSGAAWINVRAQWPGSAAYSVSTSKALAAVWK